MTGRVEWSACVVCGQPIVRTNDKWGRLGPFHEKAPNDGHRPVMPS